MRHPDAVANSPNDPAPAPGRDLRRSWTAAFVLGELVGFLPPALVGTALGRAGASDWAMILGLTLAGSLEGAAIGFTQSRVLARFVPEVNGRAWVAVTAAAAALAWFVGMAGPALFGSGLIPGWLALMIMVPAWTCAALGMGFGQWLVLRGPLPHSGRWIPVTAGAWLVAVMIPVAAISVVPNDAPAWVFVVFAVAAAVAMGVTVAALTGGALVEILRARTPR